MIFLRFWKPRHQKTCFSDVFWKKVATDANFAQIYDFPMQIYSSAELEHGPQLRPYIPRAGGQDDGSSTKLPQISGLGKILREGGGKLQDILP